MGKYIIKRLLIAAVTFFGITVLVYILASMAPGSPVEMILAGTSNLTQDDVARLEAQMGLDQPVYVQYMIWLKNVLQGNLGVSYRTMRPVTEMLAERIGPTLMLTVTALVLAILIAMPLGIVAAYRPYSPWDYASSVFSFIGAATPNFFAAMILVYLFSIKLGILPASGMYDAGAKESLSMLLRHMILPVITLMLQYVGIYTRHMRSSMLEVLGDDYVRTARAKGLRERAVIFIHALRNALIPLVTQVGLSLPALIGGAIITEQVFSWPGMGTLMVQSINYRDYPTIMGITVLIAGFVLIGNIVIDLFYGVLDPRVSRK
ncbi:MAG: ABC transporter permease [Lachnospiraceae bacterium]|nr:ABC transporter permease [Lachnospiraceae bacterium]